MVGKSSGKAADRSEAAIAFRLFKERATKLAGVLSARMDYLIEIRVMCEPGMSTSDKLDLHALRTEIQDGFPRVRFNWIFEDSKM